MTYPDETSGQRMVPEKWPWAVCSLGRPCTITVMRPEIRFVVCEEETVIKCGSAIRFGKVHYCGALWRPKPRKP